MKHARTALPPLRELYATPRLGQQSIRLMHRIVHAAVVPCRLVAYMVAYSAKGLSDKQRGLAGML